MKPKLRAINDQVVVLVGATSGIGLETAMHMVEKGAQVVIVGRSQEGLNDALERVRTHAEASRMARMHGSNGGNYPGGTFTSGMGTGGGYSSTYPQTGMTGQTSASGLASAEAGGTPIMDTEEQVIALEADITNFEQIRSVADQVVQRLGRIDTWVNVAAVSEWALFEDTSPDEFRRIIDVNLVGQAYGAMAALPYLKQQRGGSLIFVSSIAGRVPIPYQSAYNASKHGLLGLAETLRLELKHTGVPVSVTAILPASINTPLFEKARTKLGVEPEPLPPIYDTKLVAKAITYAATHPVRELIVGDAGYMMTFMRRLAPTLTSNYMGAYGFRQQRSNEPKSAQAPDNLYQHIEGYETVEGEFSPRTKSISPLTWLATHPRARTAIYSGLAAGLGAYIGYRVYQSRRKSWWQRLPGQARKTYKRMSKATGKALHNAGGSIAAMPMVSNLPMFHRKSYLERANDRLTGWLAAIASILPFVNRPKSFRRRVSDRISNVNVPWNVRQSTVDRITMAEQRKAAAQRFAKGSEKVMEKVEDQRKEAMKAVKHTVPSRRELKEIKDIAEKAKNPTIIRRQSFFERLPFGERRETIVEKIPYKK